MSKLYDHKAGQWVDVPDDQVDDLILNGKHTFETGIDIPVVAPDGELTYIKSDDAYSAFKDGYRWQNQDDRDFDYERQQQSIRQKNFDSASTAFVGGALQGLTLGGSDAALVGADALLGTDLAEARAASKEVNPGMNTAGNIAGTVASLAATGPLGAVGRGGKAAVGFGESLGAAATAGLGASRAAKAVQTMAPTIAGSIAEGAYYGLGEGISEAALGKSEDVVNNLAAGVTLGGLTGGVFGAAIGTGKVAAPYLKQAFNVAGEAGEKAVASVARSAEKKAVTAALTAQGEARLAKDFGDLVDTPGYSQIRDLFMSGEYEAALSQAKEIRKQLKVWNAEKKEIGKGLTQYFKTASDAESQAMTDALEGAAGDVWGARSQIYKSIQEKSNGFKQAVQQFTDPADAARVMKTAESLDDISARLWKINTPEAKRWSRTLADYNQRNFIRDGVITEAQEFTGLNALKRDVLDYDAIRKLGDGRVREALTDAWKLAKNTLADANSTIRPEIKAFSQQLDAEYTAYSKLGELLGRKMLKTTAVARLAADPAKLDAVEPLFASYTQFAPEFAALKSAAGNKGRRDAILKEIRAKISDMKLESVNGKLTLNDLEEIISDAGFIKGNPMAKVDQMKKIEAFLRGAENRTPLDTAVFIERQLKGSSQLEKYLPMEKQLETMSQIAKVRGDGPSYLADKAPYLGAGMGFAVGGPVGAKVGGAAGSLYGGYKSFMARDPIQMVRGIAKIERSIQSGIRRLTKASDTAVDALTSGKFRTALNVGGVKLNRKDFKKISENIKEMLNPSNQMAMLEHIPGDAVPGIQQALAAKTSLAADYLSKHIPEDPMAPYSIFPNKSVWVPSDYELSQFQRRLAVVNDPTVAVDKIAQGFVTPEEIDALKTVYPEVYQSLQEQIISGIMAAGTQPPYKARLVLAQVFGLPADYSMTPQFIGALQARMQPQDQGGRPEGSGAAPGKAQKSIDIKPMESIATETDNVTFKTDVH